MPSSVADIGVVDISRCREPKKSAITRDSCHLLGPSPIAPDGNASSAVGADPECFANVARRWFGRASFAKGVSFEFIGGKSNNVVTIENTDIRQNRNAFSYRGLALARNCDVQGWRDLGPRR
ncbi:MAG TPA: hypothetical protein VND89_05950 [Acidimicrobiales bacterium]|nr:hypothetical protein [Acidimicrobiales bacterium]